MERVLQSENIEEAPFLHFRAVEVKNHDLDGYCIVVFFSLQAWEY